jgi:hypothetical protein
LSHHPAIDPCLSTAFPLFHTHTLLSIRSAIAIEWRSPFITTAKVVVACCPCATILDVPAFAVVFSVMR